MCGAHDRRLARPRGLAFLILVTSTPAVSAKDSITVLENGDIRIGGAIRLSELASNPLIRDELAVLAAASDGIAAHRNEAATLAVNLTERRAITDNRFLALLRGPSSESVHSSDVAVALAALQALIEISTADGTRVVGLDDLYTNANLAAGDVIASVIVPSEARRGVQWYHEQAAPDGAGVTTVSIAGCKRLNGDVRIALGGVDTRPWRVNSSIEEDVSSGGLDEDIIETLAERALYDAEPISENAYKVSLASQLIRQTIGELA